MKTTTVINLSSAQLVASFTTPHLLLSAPASGYARSFLSISGKLNWVTPSYDNTPLGWIFKQPALGQGIFVLEGIINANQDNERPFYQSQHNSTVFSSVEDCYFELSALPTVGGGNLDITIVYEDNLIS